MIDVVLTGWCIGARGAMTLQGHRNGALGIVLRPLVMLRHAKAGNKQHDDEQPDAPKRMQTFCPDDGIHLSPFWRVIYRIDGHE